MNFSFSLRLLTAWLGFATSVFCQPPAAKPAYLDFEDGVPASWRTTSGIPLAISHDRYKSGSSSLLWNWRNPAEVIEYRDPAAFVTGGKMGFALWVYNEKAVAAPMWAELLNDGAVVGRVWFWMEYQGWAPLGAAYETLGCPPGTKIDTIRIHAPESVSVGRLFIDVAKFDISRISQLRTYQMPAENHPQPLTAHPVDLAYSSKKPWKNRPYLGQPKRSLDITRAEKEGMEKLAARLLPPLNRPRKGIDDKILDDLRSQMADYKIRRKDGRITGLPIDEGSLLPPTDHIDIWVYFKFCDRVRSAYDQAKKPAQQKELRQMFIDLSAHLLDQGWREGSAMRAFNNYPKGSANAFIGMRDVLEEAGLARDIGLFLAWMKACQEEGCYLQEKPYASMDGAGFWANELVSYLLLVPDPSERLFYLRAAQRYYSGLLVNRQTIAPDGCCYHHGAFHFAYASYNLPRLVRTLQAMADTDFRINRDAHERLRTYAKTIAFTLTGGVQPYNLPARAGTPLNGNMAGFAQMLVPLGSPDGKHAEDSEMISLAYAQILDQGRSGKAALEHDPMKSWIANGAKPMDMTGHMSLNGSPLAVHRRPGWMVGIAGMSSNWRGLEIYGWTQSNNYARFARNGSIAVVANGNPPNLKESGWNYDGWNWSHFPGTTSLLQSSSQLFEGYAMLSNGNGIVGGTSMNGNGIWGCDFNGGNNVAFKQSVFCFDNRITVLKSNISSASGDPVVTTLFQNHIQPGHEELHLSDGANMRLPSGSSLQEGRARWLIDNQGTGYLLPAEAPELQVQCREQEWTYMIGKFLKDPKENPFPSIHEYRYWNRKGKDMAKLESYYKPSKGNFALGYFDHGIKPNDARTAYTMLVQTTPEAMAKAAAQPPCQILQQDQNIHALHDTATGTFGYICFTPNQAIPSAGPLKENSEPCFVMIRRHPQDHSTMELSVVRPVFQSKADLTLTIAGSWSIVRKPAAPAAAHAKMAGKDTSLTLTPDYYMSAILTLKAKSSP